MVIHPSKHGKVKKGAGRKSEDVQLSKLNNKIGREFQIEKFKNLSV